MKKKYFVVKVYSESYNSSSIVFDTDSKADAFTYADLMTRNNSNGSYSFHVGCWAEQ